MDNIRERIVEEFGNKLRMRVCGICIEEDRILLINHQSLNEGGDFWAPPGGGMEFGLSAEQNLEREFLEETGLKIKVEKFLFVHEYLSPPLHAIELIFQVKRTGGTIMIGLDPEMKAEEQIIKNVAFVPWEKVKSMSKGSFHQLFDLVDDIKDLMKLSGFFRFKNELN